MTVIERRVLASRLTTIGVWLQHGAEYLENDQIGQAYSSLLAVQSELDRITFEVVKELGAIEERTR